MNKIFRTGILVGIFLIISTALYITGKRHEILIENNTSIAIKYSINGEPYSNLEAKKKVKAVAKGMGNIIYIKSGDKVIDKDLPLGISKNINLFVQEALNNAENWYSEIKE